MAEPQRKSILCPRCRRLISISEPVCPYCGISHPASWWRKTTVLSDYLKPDQITRSLIAANVFLFAISILLSPTSIGLSMNPFSFFSPSGEILYQLGATGTHSIADHRWWSLIAASYLHGGILHIFFNMMVLNQLAPFMLQEYGLNRMLIIYTLGGVVGFYVSYLAGVHFTVGASASLFALIGAILYYARSRGGTYGQMILKSIGGWVIGLFIFGFVFPGINNWAHGGGLASGVALAFFLGYEERKREAPFHRTLAIGCVAATVLILLWAVASAFYYRFAA